MKTIKIILVVFLLCIFLVSAENMTENETKKIVGKPSIKTVSLCGGCMIGQSCVEEGVQKRETTEGPLYYCGPDHKAMPAKDNGEICSIDYECKSYICSEGYCSEEIIKESNTMLIVFLIGAILIVAIAVFLIFKLRAGFNKVSKEEKIIGKEQKKFPDWQTSVKGIKQGSYKYKQKFDVLEKKLKEKFKK